MSLVPPPFLFRVFPQSRYESWDEGRDKGKMRRERNGNGEESDEGKEFVLVGRLLSRVPQPTRSGTRSWNSSLLGSGGAPTV